jgi:hypothetical protein
MARHTDDAICLNGNMFFPYCTSSTYALVGEALPTLPSTMQLQPLSRCFSPCCHFSPQAIQSSGLKCWPMPYVILYIFLCIVHLKLYCQVHSSASVCGMIQPDWRCCYSSETPLCSWNSKFRIPVLLEADGQAYMTFYDYPSPRSKTEMPIATFSIIEIIICTKFERCTVTLKH